MDLLARNQRRERERKEKGKNHLDQGEHPVLYCTCVRPAAASSPKAEAGTEWVSSDLHRDGSSCVPRANQGAGMGTSREAGRRGHTRSSREL